MKSLMYNLTAPRHYFKLGGTVSPKRNKIDFLSSIWGNSSLQRSTVVYCKLLKMMVGFVSTLNGKISIVCFFDYSGHLCYYSLNIRCYHFYNLHQKILPLTSYKVNSYTGLKVTIPPPHFLVFSESTLMNIKGGY